LQSDEIPQKRLFTAEAALIFGFLFLAAGVANPAQSGNLLIAGPW
jgi:hypothetical protein